MIDVSKLSVTRLCLEPPFRCGCDTEEEKRYKIVGEDEADLEQNKISVNSPLPGPDWKKGGGHPGHPQISPKGKHEVEVLEVNSCLKFFCRFLSFFLKFPVFQFPGKLSLVPG
ncbi:MAG: hypothetical protein Ct9H90mP9_1110 [Pseudomonadota bacterium]|nr:MAG: hypothetical protein Ct9H90mP9_1110 [Pseudomonadota bacterium]